MRRTTNVIVATLGALFIAASFRALSVKGQSRNSLEPAVDNFALISSGRYNLSVSISKGGELATSLTIPPERDFVVAFNTAQPRSHAPDGSRFEFHGDFAVYPQTPSYGYQGRFHPDKTSFQWFSEGPLAIVGHDMDLVIARVR